ncbi:hypothetical protein N8489_01940 [Akkermansiaceae bacterium]|nr:hypothetical protein [Akkermansiaceae bacterium]
MDDDVGLIEDAGVLWPVVDDGGGDLVFDIAIGEGLLEEHAAGVEFVSSGGVVEVVADEEYDVFGLFVFFLFFGGPEGEPEDADESEEEGEEWCCFHGLVFQG